MLTKRKEGFSTKMGCKRYGDSLRRKKGLRKERAQHLLGCPIISLDTLPHSELCWIKNPCASI